MEADRLRARRLPEDVVLQDANAAITGELRGKPRRSLRENLRGDDVVGLPTLQSCRVRSSGSRPGTQFTSSGLIPVS